MKYVRHALARVVVAVLVAVPVALEILQYLHPEAQGV